MKWQPGPYRPVALIVLDGWGQAPCSQPGQDAISQAATPNLDRWRAIYPHTLLGASGEDVGLQQGQMGDSNVGHLNLGAGRIVYQDLVRINKAVQEGSIPSNPVISAQFSGVAARDGTLHLLGLVSDGGVHSHLDHLKALLAAAAIHGVRRVHVHAFLDGRDVPPKSAAAFLEPLGLLLASYSGAAPGREWRLASLSGRYYAMDRDLRWERTQRAFEAIVGGESSGLSSGSAAAGSVPQDWQQALSQAYAAGKSDEFVSPVRLAGSEPLRPEDALFSFNFRADRARQLTRAFTEPQALLAGGTGITRQPWLPLPPGRFATMTRYDAGFSCPVAFAPADLRQTLGEVVSLAGRRQLRLAETEKYAHVTFFFSGGREQPFDGEERVLIPSPRVSTYDQQPEMSAPEVTAAAVAAVVGGEFDLLVVNYANCDMVGHTGDYQAALTAVEAVDAGLGQVVEAVLAAGGAALIVSDHGNAEQMHNPHSGSAHTAHTANPVPAMLIAADLPDNLAMRPGILADVAPTVLTLMRLAAPPAMHGRCLLYQRPMPGQQQPEGGTKDACTV